MRKQADNAHDDRITDVALHPLMIQHHFYRALVFCGNFAYIYKALRWPMAAITLPDRLMVGQQTLDL